MWSNTTTVYRKLAVRGKLTHIDSPPEVFLYRIEISKEEQERIFKLHNVTVGSGCWCKKVSLLSDNNTKNKILDLIKNL